MTHDAIYARYSSHAQDDSTSIEVQVEQCTRAAGGTCVHYVDRAKTGRAMGGRAQLLAMLADAADGKLRRVFVYKFDRLGRDAETHTIVRDLEENGVEVISTTEGTNALSRGIQLVVAEDYSRQLATRTRDGLAKRFEQGAFTGGVAPYGYHVTTRDGRRVLEIDADESAIIREAVGWYLGEALGFKSIAKRMQARGIASRRGKGWSFTSFRSLLLNPILTGRSSFNVRKMHLNRTTGRRLPKRRATAEHLTRQDETLRILSDETFAAIQQRLASAARGHTVRRPRGCARFTGFVHCQCGARCYRVKSENRKGTYTYYVCGRHQRYEDCRYNAHVREDELVKFVNERFARVFAHADKIIAGLVAAAKQATQQNRGHADRIKADIGEVEREQARLVELLMDRDITTPAKAAIGRKLADTEARLGELRASLSGLHEEANDNTEAIAIAAQRVLERARQGLEAASTPEAFNKFVEQFVGPMEWTPGQHKSKCPRLEPRALCKGK